MDEHAVNDLRNSVQVGMVVFSGRKYNLVFLLIVFNHLKFCGID